MAKWNFEIDFSNFFTDESVSIRDKATRIVDLVKTGFYNRRLSEVVILTDRELANIMGEMATVVEVDHFDEVMADFYDWCDFHRVWIKTIRLDENQTRLQLP